MLFFHSLETLISPEVFAEVLCDDLDLPAAAFVPAVVQAIRQQIKQFDSDSEISLDKQTDQRVIIKVGCLEVLDNSLLLKLIIHVFVLGEYMKWPNCCYMPFVFFLTITAAIKSWKFPLHSVLRSVSYRKNCS